MTAYFSICYFCVGVFPLNAKFVISKWFMSFSSFAFCVTFYLSQHILIKSPSLSRICFFHSTFHTLLGYFWVWAAALVNRELLYKSDINSSCCFYFLRDIKRRRVLNTCQSESVSHTPAEYVIIYNPRLWWIALAIKYFTLNLLHLTIWL